MPLRGHSMNEKERAAKNLHEMLILTTEAQSYAKKNNLAMVSKCIEKRRRLLEDMRTSGNASHSRQERKKYMRELLRGDAIIKKILHAHKAEIEDKRKILRGMRRLRARFEGGHATIPNFIDKEV